MESSATWSTHSIWILSKLHYLPSVVISGNTSPSLFCFSDDQSAGSPDTGMSARRGARTGLILINHHGYHSKHIMCPPHWSKLRTLCTILATSKLWCLNHALVGYLFNSLILNCASNYSTPDVSIWNLEAPLWYWFWLLLLLWYFPNLHVYFQDFRPQIKSALRGLFPKSYDWTWRDLKYDTPPTMVNLKFRTNSLITGPKWVEERKKFGFKVIKQIPNKGQNLGT